MQPHFAGYYAANILRTLCLPPKWREVLLHVYRCTAPNQTSELTAEIQVLQEVCTPPFLGQTNAEQQREILKDISLPMCLQQSAHGSTFKPLA